MRKEKPAEILSGTAKYGQWEAKAMIKNRETGEASIVSLDVLAQKPNPIRVEVTTSLGMALASVVIKESEIEYLIPKQKKYYQGPISELSLVPVLNIKVDPRLLGAAFFETAYPDWECQADGGLLESCSAPGGVQLKWERESSNDRRVSISGPAFEVQIQTKKFIEKETLSANAFALKVPGSYKKYRLKAIDP